MKASVVRASAPGAVELSADELDALAAMLAAEVVEGDKEGETGKEEGGVGTKTPGGREGGQAHDGGGCGEDVGVRTHAGVVVRGHGSAGSNVVELSVEDLVALVASLGEGAREGQGEEGGSEGDD